jgi:hypothetical protein
MNEHVLRTALRDRLDPDGTDWLRDAVGRIGSAAGEIRGLFPAVGRRCGRGPLGAPEMPGWTVDDAARSLLLTALPLTGDALVAEVTALYRFGDAAEKRAVLRGLSLLPVGDAALPLIRDALRTNDTRLVSAALGPYGAEWLDAPAYRHGVLKCVFTGIPLAEVHGLDRRVDDELIRMLRSFAEERTAAGRPVPADAHLLLLDDEIVHLATAED